MQVIVNNNQIEDFKAMKEISKPAALKVLKNMAGSEHKKSVDPWWRSRVNAQDAARNAAAYKKNLDKVSPEKLAGHTKDKLWRRAKQLKDEFQVGMLSRTELHPVKQFTENGKVVSVCDDESVRQFRSVEREMAWQKRNNKKIKEFKNIMRHLCPEDPNAGDIERFRPVKRTTR